MLEKNRDFQPFPHAAIIDGHVPVQESDDKSDNDDEAFNDDKSETDQNV